MVYKISRLRPHHVMLLGYFISVGEGESYIRRTINSMKLEEDYLDYTTRGTPLEFSQDFIDSIVDYYKELLKNREADLEIVDGVDDVCLLGSGGCNRRKASCEYRDSEDSKNFIKEKFGIGVGDICKISHIINLVEKKS